MLREERGLVRLVMSVLTVMLFVAVFAPAAAAQGILTPRTTELPDDDTYPYVPVNLNRLANDPQGMKLPADHLLAWKSIPFDVARKEAANCLFLRPIGWNGADKDNDGSYSSKYDDWHEAIKDPARALVRVPVGDYKAIWLLAATDNDAKLSELATLQLGAIEGAGPVSWHRVTVQVPRANAPNAAAIPNIAAIVPAAAGNLYIVRVPFARAIAQDYKQFRTLWLELTKEVRTAINLPDPNRFCVRPAGTPSGVRFHAVTLERSPLQMEMTAAEPGNVFNEPQVPTFHLKLVNVLGDHYIPYTIETAATADDGTVVRQALPEAFRTGGWSYGNPITNVTVRVPVPQRGQYRLELKVLARGTDLVTARATTFALLAPDTRKHRAESPFGCWDFGGGHGSAGDPDLRGSLLVKAGLRYGLSDVREAVRRKYGLLTWGDEPHLRNPATDIKAIQDRKKEDPDVLPPARFLIFHEHGISGPHVTRTPDLFTSKKYRLSPDEEKTFQTLRDQAAANVPAIRAAFPGAEIYFGNTVPHLLEELLRHGWPVKDLPTVSNESGCYMRLPETQPPDFVSDNSCLWMLRQIADHYGAKDVPLRQCLETCYPCTNPGNLTEMTQAAYLVRHCVGSLSWRVPVIRPMVLSDAGNSYYFSNWGAAGLCHAWPNIGPKPAYVAYAVLTQVLDGASFSRFIPLGSTAVYAAEFKKKDNTFVTCLWTVRGARRLAGQAPGVASVKLTNLMGRESEIAVRSNEAMIDVSERPCYVHTPQPLGAIKLGEPVHDLRPGEKSFVISPLDNLEEWTIHNGRDMELETYDFLSPRRQGNFEYRAVAGPGGKRVLEVQPKLPVAGPQYLQMYSALAMKRPVEIKGEPTQIGLLVEGNGGWGRIIFELEDAKGQRWTSIGAEQAGTPPAWLAEWLSKEELAKLNPKSMNLCDWNSDDAWGRSFINFDGWRLVKFPLPGQYPGDGYHWPMNSQWRWSGDGVVHYPLKFRRLVVTMPEKVLYGTQYIAPRHYTVRFKDLVAMYEPIEKVFAGE
jgi:hypothetical protein